MNGQSKTRTRQERIESLGIPKPRFVQWWIDSDKADWAVRSAIGLFAAAALLIICKTWEPRFAFRSGSIPTRDVIAKVDFEIENEIETQARRLQQILGVPVFYRNNPAPLQQLGARLSNRLFVVLEAPSIEEMNEDEKAAFGEFIANNPLAPETLDGSRPTDEDRFTALKAVFKNDAELKKLQTAFKHLVKDEFEYGVIQSLKHDPEQGNQQFIRVYTVDPADAVTVNVEDVQVALMGDRIEKMLAEEFRSLYGNDVSSDQYSLVAKMISRWIGSRLPEYETLSYDNQASDKVRADVAASVAPVMKQYYAGRSELASAGDPLDQDELKLLRQEHSQWTQYRGTIDRISRLAAYGGMIAALYLLCGSYIFFVDDRSQVMDRVKLSKLLLLFVAAISVSYWVASDRYRSELAPLVVASIIAAIVYGRDLALLLMAAASISVTLFLNEDLRHLVMLAAATTSATLLTGRIRSTSHLLFVGLISAAVTMLTMVGVGIVAGETMSVGQITETNVEQIIPTSTTFIDVLAALAMDSLRAGVFIIVAAAALTPVLPFIEKFFGVQTDLSLLKLSDASHPLLRRLAQRAPGTYNHSINVASIAEAAADSIGANGLLVRVGAYFHDIGKMFKPEYFIENQSGVNQHDSLQPAMSTLVIIAHVKDGADLARNHHLPQPLIDLILQHHGTTLVEYFFHEAAKRSEENPDEKEVSDKDFRYPGPKPQTLEAAVMMLADAVESASRTLVDPTPARIQSLVDKIAQKKMADGQFDECGLTFRQLYLVRKSLVKSLTAIYHARVKYPSQQPA
ncbi:HD family phosphohydrolase [Roseiconus lacunae]|uniref:HDIG domain-containing protein n=1 Tax=Roseiconus lacunae TaxID=2605694 RepID=A0ABT7PCW7_9BACT|nr:HDIG domain-containing metalloprotein [Roseiconus lacunae]MCD0459628.1 HDIG domain-containing protein [Roseiconus lacunae]MDM4014327.1 HDIG domain-containing protein [Roseiconus lacunae]WRQ49642.1 HDIG domain-containing metalloprotein [Stieleria sp. HD01]